MTEQNEKDPTSKFVATAIIVVFIPAMFIAIALGWIPNPFWRPGM